MGINEKTPVRKYNCKQAEVYTVASIGWSSCSDHLSSFAAANTRYTSSLINTRRLELQAAMTMPSPNQHYQLMETSRSLLVELAPAALTDWQFLKSYIKKSFPIRDHKTMFAAAGEQHYRKAAQNNWEELSTLMIQGLQFIVTNASVLQSTGGMPSTFQAGFTTKMTNMAPVYQQFKKAEQDSQIMTSAKITANNGVYTNLIDMFKDGQLIFKKEPRIKEKFIFDHVLEIVSGSGNVVKEYTIAAGESKTFKKVVAHSTIENIGNVTLYVCVGTAACVPATSTILLPGASTIVPEDNPVLTITNPDTAKKGICTVRIVQK